MKKIKTFWHIYKNSLLKPQYYKELLDTDINFSVKYFAALIIVMGFLYTTTMAVRAIPSMQQDLRELSMRVKGLYPDDLVISFSNDSWSINKEEPFIIPIPVEELQSFENADIPAEDIPQNLIIMDKQGTISDMEAQDALILVNETNIVVRNQDGTTNAIPIKETLPFKKLQNQQITKVEFDKIMDFTKYIPWILPFVVFVAGVMGMAFGSTVEAAIVALVLLIATLLMKMRVTYSNLFQIAMHTATLIMTLQFLLGAFNLYTAPQTFWLGHVAYGAIVLSAVKKSDQGGR